MGPRFSSGTGSTWMDSEEEEDSDWDSSEDSDSGWVVEGGVT